MVKMLRMPAPKPFQPTSFLSLAPHMLKTWQHLSPPAEKPAQSEPNPSLQRTVISPPPANIAQISDTHSSVPYLSFTDLDLDPLQIGVWATWI